MVNELLFSFLRFKSASPANYRSPASAVSRAHRRLQPTNPRILCFAAARTQHSRPSPKCHSTREPKEPSPTSAVCEKDMLNDKPAAILRTDYRPPAFSIDTVDLEFELEPAATRVRAKLAVRRAAHADALGKPLHLDGEGLELQRVRDRRAAAEPERIPGRFRGTDDPERARRLRTRNRRRDPAEGQYRAFGPLCLERHVLHPVRGRGLPPHHLFHRPAGRHVALHGSG